MGIRSIQFNGVSNNSCSTRYTIIGYRTSNSLGTVDIIKLDVRYPMIVYRVQLLLFDTPLN